VSFVPRQPDWYPVSGGGLRSIILDGFHYILRGDGMEELYDIERDAAEQFNLVNSATHQAELTRLRAALHTSVRSR
jgi:hypothetical protein